MNLSFGELLRRLRIEKGFSQQQLSDALHVDRSTVAKWETGNRLPDAVMIALLSDQLGADVAELMHASEKPTEKPNVILVDDEKIILTGGMPVLEEVMPGAVITGFTKPTDALEFAKTNKIALAFLDIEMGKVGGFDVCRELLKTNPRVNVIYLTAYMEYSFDAWDTGACGFMLKPLSAEAVRKRLGLLRHPVRGLKA